MGKVKDDRLFQLIKNYLLVYLPCQRNASEHTVTTYRTVLNQLLKFISESKNIRLLSVTSNMISAEIINAYLDDLTEKKHFSSATRNNRLAAIKAFFSYASACYPEYISLVSELDSIKAQKGDRFVGLEYMSEEAVKALLDAPDAKTKIGIRDRFIMAFLYDTGGRIQEILNLKICDLKIDKTPTVTLYGKGRKIRIVPLMENTVMMLKQYMDIYHKGKSWQSKDYLFFVKQKGICHKMSDDNVRLRLQKYADTAKMTCNSVPDHIYPHLWRHTRAMHLYQHGMDLTLISQWLGHSNIETTLVYAHADTEQKRKAIEQAMSNTDVKDSQESVAYTISDEDLLKRLYGL